MKKIIYIFPILFAVFFSACEVESGYQSGYPRTLQGKIAFDAVENRLSQSVYLLDLMTKVSYYAEAPADEKEGISHYYLSRYTITSTDNTWTLSNDSEEIIFSHNQKSINESGAIWTAKVIVELWNTPTNTIIKDENFKVENLGDKDWKVTTSNLNYFHPVLTSYIYPNINKSNGTFLIKGSKAYDKSPNLYDFKINDGSGNMNWDETKISYQITEPALYTYVSSGYLDLSIKSGKMDITANEDKIAANVIASGYYYPQVEITFNNITELY